MKFYSRIIFSTLVPLTFALNGYLISNFTVNLGKTQQAVVLGCTEAVLLNAGKVLNEWNQPILLLNLKRNYSLGDALTRHNRAKTSVILDCTCPECRNVLKISSERKYFNKTYQWMLWDPNNVGLYEFIEDLKNIGPNAQITYVNTTVNEIYSFYDVHSKGRHLKSPLEIVHYADWKAKLIIYQDVFNLQGINHRDQFNQLTLRGATVNDLIELWNTVDGFLVKGSTAMLTKRFLPQSGSEDHKGHYGTIGIDLPLSNQKHQMKWLYLQSWQILIFRECMKTMFLLREWTSYLRKIEKLTDLRQSFQIDRDNITNNDIINSILSSHVKEDGVAPFVKYYYSLLRFLQERFNFTMTYRNTRGWAGRLGGGTFRLGFLGIVMRNEVDIGASGAFNRINRFAEFDTIYQTWKFDAAFLYRFTTDIDSDGRSGNFLAPFETQVWIFSCVTIAVVVVIWHLVLWVKRKKINEEEEEKESFLLQCLAAACQQGLDPIPKGLPSRTIVFTLFLFSLVMYNYYTSSVVGGLLNSSEQGPRTITEIVNSPLKLAFEDIGYYKVLFKEAKRPVIQQMYRSKVQPKRDPDELPVFTHVKDAIPYLKKGGYAFHCELFDAYPEIARLFDANEICDLRIVSGLLETEVLNWIVPKNSMYTELFRVIMCRAKEVGIIKRTLTHHQPEKPLCQSGYTVYPVAMTGVNSAFALLGVGMVAAIIVLAGERIMYRRKERFGK